MNILYQCDEYPPVRNGGIGSVVKLVAEAMVLRGHRVMVVGDYSSQTNVFERYSEINGVGIVRFQKKDFQIFRLKFLRLVLLLLNTFNLKFFAKKIRFQFTKQKQIHLETLIQYLIETESIDMLELVDYQDLLLHTETRKVKYRKFSVPTIIRVHGSVSFLTHYINNSIRDYVLENDKLHFERADAICAVSQFSADFVKQRLRFLNVDVIYNPIEKSVFFFDEKYPTPNTVLFFGKIVETKGAFSLIKAFNGVAKEIANVQLVLIGNGEIDKAKNVILEELKDRVIFKDFMSKDELMNEIDKAYLCVLPSYFENFSMAALEVLARGRALIYTERSSGPELIQDGVNGWLVNPDDVQQIADKIIFALKNYDITMQIAKEGQKSCLNRFSTDTVIPQLEAYYQKTINEFTQTYNKDL